MISTKTFWAELHKHIEPDAVLQWEEEQVFLFRQFHVLRLVWPRLGFMIALRVDQHTNQIAGLFEAGFLEMVNGKLSEIAEHNKEWSR